MAVKALLDILQTKTRRGAARHEVTLRGRGALTAGRAAEVLIHNLSESGLLLESATRLAVGQKIIIDLPDIDRVSAKIVWASHKLLGCVFDHPLPRSAVSAAQLRSHPKERLSGPLEMEARARIGEDAETFGARLKDLRKEAGLSLVEFARRMHVSRPTIWSWESGKSLPRQSKLQSLLRVLEISEAELCAAPGHLPFDRDTPDTSAQMNALRNAINEAKARVAEIAGTSPEKIKLIIEV